MSAMKRHLETMAADIGICADCLMWLANDECEGSDGRDYRAGIDAIGGSRNISLGLHPALHAPDCARRIAGECQCAEFGFTSADCDLCNSRLAGDRFAATVWDVTL